MSKIAYKKRLGWLNVDEKPIRKGLRAGAVFRTRDGRAWMTRGGDPVLVPDDYKNHGLSDEEVAPLPDEVDIAWCPELRGNDETPTVRDRSRARKDIIDVCAALKSCGDDALGDVINFASGDVDGGLFDLVIDELVRIRCS